MWWASVPGVLSASNQKETRTVTLFCQIVDDSGKLLTRRSLSLRRSLSTRRSSSMQWQPSASLHPGPAKGLQLKQGPYEVFYLCFPVASFTRDDVNLLRSLAQWCHC